MKRKLILYILLFLWMGLIFFFSHQPSIKSNSVSDGVMSKIINVIENVFNYNFSENEIVAIYNYGIVPLRKFAHLFIYFVLGILFYNLVRLFNFSSINKLIVSLLFCILYACSDEIHQLFIFGRSGEIRDVIIDSIGSLLGIFLVIKFFNRRCDGNEKENI